MSQSTQARPARAAVRTAQAEVADAPQGLPHPTRTAPAPSGRRARLGLWAVMVGAAAVYIVNSFRRFAEFRSGGYDEGIFDQAIRHYAAFDPPITPVKGPDFNLLGDHFHPIIALLAPLYWIWADPRCLEIANALLIVSSFVPVHRFHERHLGSRWATLATAGYAAWWPIETLADFGFHEVSFGVPVVAWLIDALDTARYRRVVVLSLVLLLVREDMGAVVLMVAVILALRHRWRLAGALAVTGVVACNLATAVVIPSLAPDGRFGYWNYPALGHDAPSALGFAVTHPWTVLGLLVANHMKRRLLLYLALPVGAVAVFSPYSLLALPLILERLLSSRPGLWQIGYHYNGILAPILLMAMVDVVARLRSRRPQLRFLPALPAVALLGSLISGIAIPNDRPYLLKSLFTPSMWADTAHTKAQRAALALIPRGVCVEADNRLVPHLAGRNWVTTPLISGGRATWMILDERQRASDGLELPPPVALREARRGGFVPVFAEDGVIVLHRAGPVDPVCGSID